MYMWELIVICLLIVLNGAIDMSEMAVVPKRVALHSPERIAAIVAPPMLLISKVAAPLAWFLKIAVDTVLRLLKRDTARDSTVTEDEIKSLITEGTQVGVFIQQEREMIE